MTDPAHDGMKVEATNFTPDKRFCPECGAPWNSHHLQGYIPGVQGKLMHPLDTTTNLYSLLHPDFRPGGTKDPKWMEGVRGFLPDCKAVEPSIVMSLFDYYDALKEKIATRTATRANEDEVGEDVGKICERLDELARREMSNFSFDVEGVSKAASIIRALEACATKAKAEVEAVVLWLRSLPSCGEYTASQIASMIERHVKALRASDGGAA